ncbi:Zinc finger, DHHC-type, palmitoyltransferase [Cynara cardunculus var. scolymus]|uniref:S-acyltransferase n=1 Tax=Cynara cardunculus var. scolymus TaxID=59895 RepID=A0A103YAF6_CYNCS|nr:Zinc finger, DHHC-type, palmitoyltransferase [Cynara cardunculus var. scolymus]
MRKHGWQLPYHPLQVVAVSVFLALGFGFYVFFAPFVGKKMYQYIVMGIYTPLIISAFGLYIWCAGADPADPGVFKSKKYLKTPNNKTGGRVKESKLGGESTSSIQDANAASVGEKSPIKNTKNQDSKTEDNVSETEKDTPNSSCSMAVLALVPCALICHCSSPDDESSELQTSEDGMFYCSLCEVEVFKYSKHCRVCDKCVDRFDHHCRWLNNCVGKKNYRKFFTLMVSALLLLILQWSTGIVVLICCFLDHKRFSLDIATKLGSSFSLVPYVIVVAVCTILAMIATLPLVQLFFFHILLIKKGISTYDYIIALREQEQQGLGGQQSPQMSPASSITGLSSASSFNTFLDEPMKKKNPTAVKISPWTLARLNAEEVSKAAAEARKKSKILQPVSRKDAPQMGPYGLERDSSLGSSERRLFSRIDNNNNRRRGSKRVRLPEHGLPLEQPPSNHNMGNDSVTGGDLSSLVPLQLEARSVFRPMSGSTGIIGSSPDSSLDSSDIHPVRISSGAEEARKLPFSGAQGVMPLSRSTSDGYDASGGEDSDRVPSRLVQRSGNWSARLFGAEHDERIARFKMASSSSSSYQNERKL